MRTNKMILAIVLLLAMLTLAACSGNSETKLPIRETKAPETTEADPAETPTDVESDDEETETTSETAEETEEPEEPKEAKGDVTVETTLLYDVDGVKVSVTGLEEDWLGYYELKFLIENDSDKDIYVDTDSFSVNGYMQPHYGLYCKVAAGKKANDDITLYESDLKKAGIDMIAEIQLYISVIDAETWGTLYTSELITIETSAAGYEQPVDDSGEILYDADGIRIICKGLKEDVLWDGELVFLLENNSGKDILISTEDVSVNGFMQDMFGLWSELRDGTRLIDDMSLTSLDDIEIESIDDVKNIEFAIEIMESETWNVIAITDVISLNFE